MREPVSHNIVVDHNRLTIDEWRLRRGREIELRNRISIVAVRDRDCP